MLNIDCIFWLLDTFVFIVPCKADLKWNKIYSAFKTDKKWMKKTRHAICI